MRYRAGFTQMDVAEKLGMSQAAYSRLEKGKTEITVVKLLELCDMYGVKPELLVKGL